MPAAHTQAEATPSQVVRTQMAASPTQMASTQTQMPATRAQVAGSMPVLAEVPDISAVPNFVFTDHDNAYFVHQSRGLQESIKKVLQAQAAHKPCSVCVALYWLCGLVFACAHVGRAE